MYIKKTQPINSGASVKNSLDKNRSSENLQNVKNVADNTMKNIGSTLMKKEDVLAVAVNIKKKKPTLLLSWKKNFKAVTNRMRKYMEVYPETCNGFFVQFVEDSNNEWYDVRLCNSDEEGEEFNWIKYKVLTYKFEKS